MKEQYYLFGCTVCHETIRDDSYTMEYFDPVRGWIEDRPGKDYRDYGTSIRDALHAYGDYSPADVNLLDKETAMKITEEQKKHKAANIPGLNWGGSYTG